MKKYFSTIILGLVCIAGLLTFDEYGESWDDRSLQKYAELSMQAYATWPQQGFVEVDPQNLAFYGPFFVSFVAMGSQFLHTFLPFQLPDLRHLIYFLTWFAGILAFYSIVTRWLSQLPALGATLLYATQPLLWGHVFINPKDTPFLALFTISLALGFKMIDAVRAFSLKPLDKTHKRSLTLLTALWVASVFSLFIFTENVHTIITNLVQSAQAGEINIITYIASKLGQVSAEAYIQRYFLLFLRIRLYYTIILTALLLFTWYRIQPDLINILVAVFLPSVLLGVTVSTRIIGPFAGGIIVIHALSMIKQRALPALAMYGVIAMAAAYLSWPYLWMNPILRAWGSFVEMSSYPWFGEVLFNGKQYPATDLPYAYLPVLFAIQLTEPVWILTLIGLFFAVRAWRANRSLLLLVFLWFFVPVFFFITRRVVLYDNFRQVLFVLPPVFLLAGVAFENIKNAKWQAAAMGLSLIPGLFGIISLHPYEYIYYNSFAGGVENAQERFETDYWLTSYREAAEYLNRAASPTDLIWVEGPGHLYSVFARYEENIYSWSREQSPAPFDYIVVTTRFNADQTVHPEAEVIYKIERGGAVLTVIKKTLKEK